MTRFYTASGGGRVNVKGHTYSKVVGSRAQVWHGTAHHTRGGLIKGNLMLNKHGRIVSRRKHTTAKRQNILYKLGYRTQKGKFGVVYNGKTLKRRHRRHRGGFSAATQELTPAPY